MAYERIRPGHAPLECAHVVLGTFAFDDTDDVDSAGNRNAEGRMAVCLAMVLDEDGMPAGYRLLEADPDEHAVRSLVNDIKKSTGTRRVVMVAGRLSRAEAIMKMLAAQEDGFIMHRPLETAVEDMRHWVVDDQGYTTSRSGNYRIKSRVRAATVKAPDTSDGKEPAHAAKHVHVRDIVFLGSRLRFTSARRPSEAEATTLDGYACIVTSELISKPPRSFTCIASSGALPNHFRSLNPTSPPRPTPRRVASTCAPTSRFAMRRFSPCAL